ncbi:MAG: type III-A CRISPR-associated RAMP protein Csm3, partial [Dehalococcoidia bacterium]
HLLDAMQFLEDDYLGGLGTRGSGKIAFQELSLTVRTRERYLEEKTFEKGLSLRELTAKEEELVNWLHQTFSW